LHGRHPWPSFETHRLRDAPQDEVRDSFTASQDDGVAASRFNFQTADTLSHSRSAKTLKSCKNTVPPRREGAGDPKRDAVLPQEGSREDRVRAAPAVSRANAQSKNAHEHTGSAEAIRPSLRNGFTAYFALSLVNGLFCHHRRADTSARLERQRRGVRTTRLRRPRSALFVKSAFASTASPPNVRDDRDPPL
jgi:hypothetical protein